MSKVRFGDVLYIKGRIGWQLLRKDEYLDEGDYYLVTGVDITDTHRIDFNNCYYVSKERYEKDDKIQLKVGDIIVTKDGTIGKIGIIDQLDKPATLNSHLFLIRNLAPDILDTGYLFQILRSKTFQKYAANNTSGSNIPAFTQANISNFEIELPPLELQRKIANVLANIDEKIVNNYQIISKLESLAKTTYDYWFLQFEFPNEDGKPYKSSGGKMVWNEELKREIPEGWNVTNVGNITACLDSKRVPLSSKDRENMKGPYPYYGATSKMDSVNEYLFDGDYVLLAEDGSVMDDNGFPILQRTSGKVWVNNHAHVLQPKKPYGCKLLMFILKNIPVSMIKTGSIQMKVNQENLNAFKVLSIPENLIEKANSILNPIDAKIIMLKQENQELASLRDFILPMLMNGQVAFKEEA